MDILLEALKDGIAPAIVVAIYLVITKVIDSKRESAQTKLSGQLVESINNISSFIKDLTKNIIVSDKDKCKNAVEDSMGASGMRLINFVASTIINNHVDTNKINILENIKSIVNAEFYSVYTTLSMYNVNGTKISDYLNKDWMKDVEDDIIHIIYDVNLSKEDKILAFSNKLNIKFQSYITNIINHIVKQ